MRRKLIHWLSNQGDRNISIVADVPIDSAFLAARNIQPEQIVSVNTIEPALVDGVEKWPVLEFVSLNWEANMLGKKRS